MVKLDVFELGVAAFLRVGKFENKENLILYLAKQAKMGFGQYSQLRYLDASLWETSLGVESKNIWDPLA